MDVDRLSFYPLLLDIFTDISEAHFVSIDLELSGVPSKDSYSVGAQAGKPTLQQRYEEIKAAAERYQILQLGITCVQQDVVGGKYVLRPYNFNLCPFVNEPGVDVERIFSFQSGAGQFLLNAGFDFNKCFKDGVPYLSRKESKLARHKLKQRQDKTALADMQIKPTDTEALAFLDRVRNEINEWVSSGKPDTIGYLNVCSAQETGDLDEVIDLSRFEKRLVHQIVRAEYPNLVTLSKPGFIQIKKYDQEREESFAAKRKAELEERISRQKGLRWVIEALHGSNISNFDPKECASNARTGAPILADLDRYKAQFTRAQSRMLNNPRVLVGHNCFLDMIYIYHTFIGELPSTVAEFQRKLHSFWPVIVDTKYMSTHNCGDINPASSLAQIAGQLSDEKVPVVETHREHPKYDGVEAFHEAGYDSYLTAQVAVRLSAKLERLGQYIVPESPMSHNGVKDATNGIGELSLTHERLQRLDSGVDKKDTEHLHNHSVAGESDARITLSPGNATVASSTSDLNAAASSAAQQTTSPTGFTPSDPNARWKRNGEQTLGPQNPNDPFKYSPRDRKHRYVPLDVSLPNGMPKFDSDFWRVYGNKLRVFGTEEGVFLLDPLVEEDDGEEGGVGLD